MCNISGYYTEDLYAAKAEFERFLRAWFNKLYYRSFVLTVEIIPLMW